MDRSAEPPGNEPPESQAHRSPDFVLQTFFPYLARLFYTQISGAVSGLYEEPFGMKRYEWRTLAILGQTPAMTASGIVAASSMDKVSVSRAITALRGRGWIAEQANKADARSRLLRLSRAGREVYETLAPQMIALEQRLLADLSDEEIVTLKALMARVTAAAVTLRNR